jgi:glutamyl-tRNA reductase
MARRSTLRLYSFSHKNTSLKRRDALAFSYDQIGEFLPEATDRFGGEYAVVSTCNRTEFYCWNDAGDDFWEPYSRFIARFKEIEPQALASPEVHTGLAAARHLCRVAASLESLALGENEILGQVKDAHQIVLDSTVDASVVDQLFQFAIRAGKDVRTDTALCEGSVSVSSVAVDLAQKIFGDFSGRNVMLLGAGETAETAAEHFRKAGASQFIVVNRSRDTGRQLADRFDGDFIGLSDLDEAIERADVAVVATGSQEPLVTADMMRQAMKRRRQDPVFLIDISNPRNVDPACSDLPSVYLYNMDDLQKAVDANLASRQQEIPEAESIVDHYVDQWDQWVQQLQVTPTISTLARFFEEMRQQEMGRLNGELTDEERDRLETFSKGLVKKLLHNPITTLRSAVDDDDLNSDDLDLIWSLYNLHEFEEQSDED